MLKRIISSLLFLLMCLTATAEFRWGPTVGMNVSTFWWKQSLLTTNQRVGVNAGVMGELMIPGIGFGIDMAVKYQLHGASENFSDFKVWNSDGIKNQNVWMHTLQIPINLRFKWTRMEGFEQYLAPIVYAGPIFCFNLASNHAPAIQYPAGTVGIQCGLGAEIFERWQVTAGYYWGLTYQIKTIKLDNYSASPRGWQLNFTYLF